MSENYTLTPALGLFKPNYRKDSGKWGDHWNANADMIDAAFSGNFGGPYLPLTGGTVTGPLNYTVTGGIASRSAQDRALDEGLLIDEMKQPADPDDTASLIRATATGLPLRLGSRTYIINGFAVPASPSFVLRGIRGRSIIQRTVGTGSEWFTIHAVNTVIEDVIFDMNKAAVTTNQWGLLFADGGQTIDVRGCVFKNNSGNLGAAISIISTGPAAGGSFSISDCEISGCGTQFQAVYIGGACNGRIDECYVHDNGATGIAVMGGFSPTAYAANVNVTNNRVINNTGSGISFGGFGTPYIYGSPPPQAVMCGAIGNILVDNASYQIGMMGDNLLVIGNELSTTTPTTPCFGYILATCRDSLISGNKILMGSIGSYGIDAGSAQNLEITGNHFTLSSGSAVNIGGTTNSSVRNNKMMVNGTGFAVSVYNVEGDGNNVAFPYVTSNLVIENNDIVVTGDNARGLYFADNAGGFPNADPCIVRGNNFQSPHPNYDVLYYGSSESILVQGNTHNGSSIQYSDPLGANNDMLFDIVFDEIYGVTSTSATLGSIITGMMYSYGNTTLQYIDIVNGGAGYSASTTLTVSGGGLVGATAFPQISQGKIWGVRVGNRGTGATGPVTVTVNDPGGGTGASFTAVTAITVPTAKRITFKPAGPNLLRNSGGMTGIVSPTNILLVANHIYQFEALFGGTNWMMDTPPNQTYASGSLPTPSAAMTGVIINVTGAAGGKWLARCNGTNWIAPDGTTIT